MKIFISHKNVFFNKFQRHEKGSSGFAACVDPKGHVVDVSTFGC
jgi:hypothetical protein